MARLLTLLGVAIGAVSAATNRLIYENSNGILLENSSGDLALE